MTPQDAYREMFPENKLLLAQACMNPAFRLILQLWAKDIDQNLGTLNWQDEEFKNHFAVMQGQVTLLATLIAFMDEVAEEYRSQHMPVNEESLK